MTSIADLVAALRADKIKLLGVFDALAARGFLPAHEHRAEVEWLDAAVADGTLEPVIARALVAKLESLQVSTPTEAPQPAGNEPTAADAGIDPQPGDVVDDAAAAADGDPSGDAALDDATVVQPASRPPTRPSAPPAPPAPAADDEPDDAEITRVLPAARPPAAGADASAGDATMVKPASGTARATAGSTGTQSGTSQSTWRHMADAEVGDYVTVGSLLKGRFYLEKELGRGGMGVVFMARDERKVEARDRDPYLAVKVLNDEFRRHPDSLIALQRESRRSQQLAHDNIVRVFDFDKDRTTVFMTMEYIDGSDLKALIRERAYNGMPLARARPLIEGMARALGRAHAAGVVHSDFKPGNVMVTREGVPKVFDFGIARAGKHMGDATGEMTVFDAGTLGALTPAYASLEMIHGKDPSPGDDIYALGCVTFELLTGKHPFDKVSAEVAMKEGRKPPPVPGLTRRQYRTLCAAVAFTADQRLRSADELVQGLRDVGLRERAMPWLVWGGAGLVLLIAAAWGWTTYSHHRHVDRVVARFALASPDHYASEKQAEQALEGLGEEDRKRVVIDHGDEIQRFLLARLDAYWNPAQGRYDYAGAQHVLQWRDELKLYSPQLDVKRSEIDEQKDDLLNTLDTRLSQQIEAGRIFDEGSDNVVQTLGHIHAIDPDSTLLRNPELELKYDTAIGQSLEANRLDQARQRLAQARQLFPDSARLAQREAQLAALDASQAARHAASQGAAAQSIPEARAALAKLVAQPRMDASWQASVAAAMTVLADDHDPQTLQLVQQLDDAIAAVVAPRDEPAQLPQAVRLVDLGLTYAPDSKPLLAQRQRLAALQQQQQAQADRESVAAEVKSRIESMKRAAAASDTAKASESLARIRTLQPDHPFLKTEGPQLLADAYLGLAIDTFRRGRYSEAADVLSKGIATLGKRSDLRRAQARYQVVAQVMQAGAKPLSAAQWTRLRQRLQAVRADDAGELARLEADLRIRGQLPGKTLDARLEKFKPSAAAARPAPPAATPTATPSQPGGDGAAAPARQAPKPAVAAQPAAPPATQPATGGASASASAPDRCAKPGLVGSGRLCFDMLGDQRGPLLAVVPGLNGGKPYAMSRAEISIVDYNKFCAATRKCTPRAVADRDFGNTPASDISVATAKAYAAWLTRSSGHVYRLPTDAEWLHAAKAGGGFHQAPDSNCIPPTAGGAAGSGAAVSARGRSDNPWGLVNTTGNVWEWTLSGGSLAVRGGSFTSYWSACTVDNQRADDGSPRPDVGFRILREVP